MRFLRSNWMAPGAILLIILLALGCLAWTLISGAGHDQVAGSEMVSNLYHWQLEAVAQKLKNEYQSRSIGFANSPENTIQQLLLSGYGCAVRQSASDPWIFPVPSAFRSSLSPEPLAEAIKLEAVGQFSEAAKVYLAAAATTPVLRVDEVRCYINAKQLAQATRSFHQIPEFATDSRGVPLKLLAGLLFTPTASTEEMENGLYRIISDYTISIPSKTRHFLLRELANSCSSPGRSESYARLIQGEKLSMDFVENYTAESFPAMQKLKDGQTLFWHPKIQLAVIRKPGPIATLSGGETVYLAPVNDWIPGENNGTWTTFPLTGIAKDWRLATEMDESILAQATSKRAHHRMLAAIAAVLAVCGLGGVAIYLVVKQWKRVSMRNTLAATVSHELKTPLTTMQLMIDALEDDAISLPDRSKCRKILKNENIRLSRLVNQFLNFSRMERGIGTFEKESIAMADVVNEALAVLEEKLHEAILKWESPTTIPKIPGNKDALVTATVNLIENSLKYSGSRPAISIQLAPADDTLKLSISDRGQGMTPSQLKRATETFYQGDRSMTRVTDGCGMGLAIVKWITQGHGGELKLSSTKGVGTTAEIILPLNEATK